MGDPQMTLEVPYRSIPEMFLKRVAATPDSHAFGGPDANDAPVWHTWAQIGARAKAIAAGLTTLGVGKEDRVAILAEHPARLGRGRPRHHVRRRARRRRSTRRPSRRTPASSSADSGSKVLIAENPAQAAKMDAASCPGLTHVVLIDGEVEPPQRSSRR